VFATGVAVNIFREYQINYAFIFEIDQHYKLIHHQLYRLALIFSFLLGFCFIWQVALIKLDSGNDAASFALLCLIIFLLICLMPFHIFYLKARIQVAKTLGQIFISPFGKVRFRHFFLADVLTSIISPLQNLMIMGCFYIGKQQDWKTSTKVNFDSECDAWSGAYVALGFIPYWWRCMQCWRKFYDSDMKIHLVNAGKYFSDLCVPFAGLWLVKSQHDVAFWTYVLIHFIASTYSYIWDIYMDWGLLRQMDSEKPFYLLRAKCNYKPSFYFFAAGADLLLRFTWLISTFWLVPSGNWFYNFNMLSLLLIFAEAFRRALWGSIRVENEQNNNFETYRTIPIIPPIV